ERSAIFCMNVCIQTPVPASPPPPGIPPQPWTSPHTRRTTVILSPGFVCTQRKKSVCLLLMYYCSAGITFSLGFLRHSSISTGPDRAYPRHSKNRISSGPQTSTVLSKTLPAKRGKGHRRRQRKRLKLRYLKLLTMSKASV